MKTRASTRFSRWFGALSAGPTGAGASAVELSLPPGWPETDASVRWWNRVDETNGHSENAGQLPASARAASILVWTPAADTLLTHANVPTRSRARILQALPYALEDQLLDEPEALHFAYVREADGTLAVAVTQRARLNVWLDILKSAGVRPAGMCPANLSLPLYPDTWSLAFVGNELWVRSGSYSGFVTSAAVDPPPLLLAALKEAVNQQRAPQRLLVFAAPATLNADTWSDALQLPVTVDTRDFHDLSGSPPLNLLQADFGQAAHLRQALRPLRPAAIMLAIWFVATTGLDVAEWLRLRHQHSVYAAEMRDIFQRNFPEVKTVLDPAAQMRSQIAALQSRGTGPADLLPLLTRVAPTLKAQAARVKLHSLKYGERSLTLELTLPNYQALDTVKNAFRAANLDVEILAANGRGDEVDGRLRVRPGGAVQPTKET